MDEWKYSDFYEFKFSVVLIDGLGEDLHKDNNFVALDCITFIFKGNFNDVH